MNRSRVFACLLALALAVPSAAFAQGAGDDQYQDPFGDEQTTARQDDGSDDGLTDAPPVDQGGAGSGRDSGAGAGGSGSGDTSGSAGTGTAPAQESALPNTGSDPRVLAFLGVLFVLVGVGLRLRTLDPDAY